jgi:hypothetical protein
MKYAYIHVSINYKGTAFESNFDILDTQGLRLHNVAKAVILLNLDTRFESRWQFGLGI